MEFVLANAKTGLEFWTIIYTCINVYNIENSDNQALLLSMDRTLEKLQVNHMNNDTNVDRTLDLAGGSLHSCFFFFSKWTIHTHKLTLSPVLVLFSFGFSTSFNIWVNFCFNYFDVDPSSYSLLNVVFFQCCMDYMNPLHILHESFSSTKLFCNRK